MSLILEALKKSEQERRRERVPDLRTVHQPVVIAPPRRLPWGWLAVALVVINLNGLAAWWLLREPAAGTPPAPAQAAPAAATHSEPPPPVDPRTAEAASRNRPVAAAALFAAPVPPAAATSERRSIAELPPSVRAALPAMTFSFHVFSPNRERRSIIINEHRLREGDQIGDGWWLEEVTEEGVVVTGAGERVYIPVLSQW